MAKDGPATRISIHSVPDGITGDDDRRLVEMMRTGGVLLVPERMTDLDIDEMKEVLGADADIRRAAHVPENTVEFFRRSQAIKFGLLPGNE